MAAGGGEEEGGRGRHGGDCGGHVTEGNHRRAERARGSTDGSRAFSSVEEGSPRRHTSMGMRKQAKPTPLLWCQVWCAEKKPGCQANRLSLGLAESESACLPSLPLTTIPLQPEHENLWSLVHFVATWWSLPSDGSIRGLRLCVGVVRLRFHQSRALRFPSCLRRCRRGPGIRRSRASW